MSTDQQLVETRCGCCKLPLTATVGPIEHHPRLGWACWTCRHTDDMAGKVLSVLAKASACRLNQRTIAGKLGYKPTEINVGLVHLSRLGLIERAFSNPNLERPSAVTYQLTQAGRIGMGLAQ